MPNGRFDVAIIGAGIVGLSSAYYIKKNNPDLNVVVIDRAPTYAQGNTARSAAGFRDMFSSNVNFGLSNSTVKFYRHVQNDLKVDLGMKFVGYLFLMNEEDERLAYLEEVAKKTSVKKISLDELSRYDFLRTKLDGQQKEIMHLQDINFGLLGENCGTIEPEMVADFYYKSSVDLGVNFMFNTEVKEYRLQPVEPMEFPGEPFVWQEKRLKYLETDNGKIEADTFISATDVWTTGLLDPTGIDSHIRPKKRQVFQIGGSEVEKILYGWDRNEDGVMPFTILPSHGVFLRPAPKFKSFWVGTADDYNREFSFMEEPEAEKSFYEYNVAQVIQAYFPSLASPKLTGMWAGYYAYNTIDGAPYIFKDLNIIVATGTSGSGILKGDSIGRMVEAVYSGREYADLYGGRKMKTTALGIADREMNREKFII